MPNRVSQSVLVILGGLPGAGKSTIVRTLARQIGALHLRVDTIEQAIRGSSAPIGEVTGHGYRVAYVVAEDNLQLGNIVIADTVNPLYVTREAWRAVAERTGSAFIEVEVVCSDPVEHRRRVESRVADIEGLVLPTWAQVLSREYQPWNSARLVVDTAVLSAEEAAAAIHRVLAGA